MDNYFIEKGAFKEVKVYKNHVVKILKEDGGSNGDDTYSSSSTSWESQVEEIEQELTIMRKYRHLSIIPKLIWADDENYTFAAERVFHVGHYGSDKKELNNKVNIKRVAKEVVKKLRLRNIHKTVKEVANSEEYLIGYGLSHNLPFSNLVDDIVNIMYLDKQIGISQDLHCNNYGIKNGHIVIIDLGQSWSSRKVRKSYKTKRQPNKRFNRKLDPSLEKTFIKLLGLIDSKRPIVLISNNATLTITKIKEYRISWGGNIEIVTDMGSFYIGDKYWSLA